MPIKCKEPVATVYVQLSDLNQALRTHAAEVPHLEPVRVRLEVMLEELSELTQLQTRLTFERQETTRRIEEILDQLCKTGNFLKVGLREHLGTTNEKLVAFGLQPFRGRRRAKPTEAVEEEAEMGQGEPDRGQ